MKEIVFDSDWNAGHTHDTLLASYPVLRDCVCVWGGGGGTLSFILVLSGSQGLVEIEGPDTGITVPY